MQSISRIKPNLKTGCAQPYVAIPVCLTLQEMGKTHELVYEVKSWLNDKKLKIAGPLFYRYHTICQARHHFHLEVGFPVCTPAEGDDRVVAGIIPDGTFATLLHCGHPNHIDRSFNNLQNWANGQGIKWETHHQDNEEVWAGRFNFYLTDQASEPDEGKWRTAIAVLIKS